MREREGFTLIELVVVIMILGILGAVAAPRFMNTSAGAADSGLKQSLSVIRSAIEMHAAENAGAYPSGTDEATFKEEIGPYLRGSRFPTCPVGNRNDEVAISDATPLAAVGGTASWVYNPDTGEFICNSDDESQSDPGVKYSEF